MGDIFIPIFVYGLLIGTPLFILFIVFSKNNKGAWDDESRLKGQMRSKGWRVRDTVKVIEDFLFRNRHDLEHWPIPRSVPGVQAVSSNKDGNVWNAVTLNRPSKGSKLMVSLELPQLSDGSEAEMTEALVVREGDGYDVRTSGAEFPFFVTEEVRGFIENWEEPDAFHFIGDSVTAFFDTEYGQEDIIERLEEYSARLSMIKGLLPREVWK